MAATAVRPGTNVVIGEFSPPRSVPTNTGVWFVTGLTGKGPLAATLVRGLSEFVSIFGDRVAYGSLYDALEMFFQEGGARAYVSRVVGPAAITATKTLNDGSAVATLRVDAIGPGDWGNALNVQVVAGDQAGNFKLLITDDVLGTLEVSPDLADKSAALDWARFSQYVVLADLATSVNDPAVVAAQSLAGGTDDRVNITDTQWLNALNQFTRGLGPGQVSAPGRVTDVGHQQLVTHAVSNNRVAILDAPDTNTQATIKSSAVGAGTGTDRRFAAMFWPWLRVPGLTPGTYRSVGPSALVAGSCARNTGQGRSVSAPCAGTNGISKWALGLSRPAPGETPITEVQREDLNESGINVIRSMFGGIRIYGWRSLTNPVTDSDWLDFGDGRIVMAISAEADVVMELYMFGEIDGRGHFLGDLKADLNALLIEHYEAGSLYGANPDDAFFVDVGSQVNTPETLSNNEIHASISIRTSPMAEYIEILLVKKPITEAVS
jgi:hypothetical protein